MQQDRHRACSPRESSAKMHSSLSFKRAGAHRFHSCAEHQTRPGIRVVCSISVEGPARALAMAQTVGDFIVERLHAWGVRKIFGYPGDGINGVFGALNRAHGKIEFIQARHEEMAAFM